MSDLANFLTGGDFRDACDRNVGGVTTGVLLQGVYIEATGSRFLYSGLIVKYS